MPSSLKRSRGDLSLEQIEDLRCEIREFLQNELAKVIAERDEARSVVARGVKVEGKVRSFNSLPHTENALIMRS